MNDKAALSFLEKEIQLRIESFDSKRKFYRQQTERFTLSTAILSALTTFLIGVSQAYNLKIISMLALATSAGMSVLTAWDGMYNYRRRWVQNNSALMKLYELKSDVKYAKAIHEDNLDMEAINNFHVRYQEVLRLANEDWKEDRLASPTNHK